MRKTTALCFLLAVGACARNAYTPPARPFALTTPATVGKSRSTLQVVGGFHGTIFGPDLVSATVQGRRGLLDDLDLVIDGSVVHVTEDSAAGTNPNIFMLRVGVKHRLFKHMALVGGAGGGYSPAGGPFVSADIAVVGAYENCYVVPFLSIGAFVSEPLNPHNIDITQPGDQDPVIDRPETTVGVTYGGGLKVPLPHHRCEEGPARVALVGGLGFTYLSDSDSDDQFISGTAGVEINF